MEILKERGVEGSGNLEGGSNSQGWLQQVGKTEKLISGLLDLRPELDRQTDVARTKRADLTVARNEVMALLKRYNEFVSFWLVP